MARVLDLDGQFMKDLKDGVLSEITTLVKKREDLIMSFRDGRVNVYYKGHSLFEISKSRNPKGYSISFDIGHARYTDYYENIDSELKKLNIGIETEQKSHKKGGKIDSYSYSARFVVYDDEANNNSLLPVMERYIKYADDFLDMDKQHDYFKDKEVYETIKKGKKKKSYPLERVTEQEYMLHNNTLQSDYYLIDMEYSVTGLGYGRFDMIGISKEKNSAGKYTIALIELKSDTGSIGGTFTYSKKDNTRISSFGCGVAGHIVNYYKFLYGKKAKENTERLAKEISFAIKASHLLGLNLSIPEIQANDIDVEVNSVKCLLVISDLGKKQMSSALSSVGNYIFTNAKGASEYCLEKHWKQVQSDEVDVTDFVSDYDKIDMRICLCDKERNIECGNFRKLDLGELEKWKKELICAKE